MPSACALTSHTEMSTPAVASMMTPRRRFALAWVIPRSSAGVLREPLHLLVDALGEHRILTGTFRRELMFDDGGDDRRRAESSTDASEPAVRLDADQGRITLDLRSEVGAVALFLRDRSRHRNRRHFDDF